MAPWRLLGCRTPDGAALHAGLMISGRVFPKPKGPRSRMRPEGGQGMSREPRRGEGNGGAGVEAARSNRPRGAQEDGDLRPGAFWWMWGEGYGLESAIR